MATATKSIKSTPVRFTLTNGENIVLPCTPDMTLGSIKEKIWQKKHYQNDKSQYVFRLLNGEIFFRDTQTISSLFKLEPVFRETRQKPDILEMILLPLVDVGDKRKREAKTPGTANKPLLAGILYKRGRTGTIQSALPWKKTNGGAAIDVVAMGSVFAVHAPEFSYKNWPYCFELKAESVGKRDFVLCAESQPEMETWIQLIFAVNFRRIKSITVTICEELSSRGLSKMEGIFRVSGSKEVVANIKQQYNLANYPNLTEVKDDHALSGTLKLAIREMSEPLLTYALYKQFIALHGIDPSKRRAQARAVIKQLPPANAAFLQYLCLFLKHVSTFKETNMMTAKNLSIVFAPNILRPREENVASTMVDNNAVLAAVEYLIDSADQIWNGDDEDFPNGISFEAGEALAGGFVPAATSFSSGAASPLARPQTGPSVAASMNISAPAAWAGTVEKEIPGPPPGSPPNGGEFVAQSNPPPVPARAFPPSAASSATPFGVKKFGGGPPPTPPPGNPVGFLGGAIGGANKQTLDAVQLIRKKYEESIASFEQKMTTRKLEAKRAFDNVITQVNAGGQDPSLLPMLESLVSEEDQWRQEALININDFASKLNQLATTLQQARTANPPSQPPPPQHTPPPPPTTAAPPPISVSVSTPAPTPSPPNSFRANPPRFPIPNTSPTSSASNSASNSNTPSPAPSPSSNTHSIADNPFKKMQMQMNKSSGPPPVPSNMLSSPSSSSSSSTSEDTPISPFKKFGAGAPPPPPGGAAGAKSPIVPSVSRVASPPPPAAAAATNGNGHSKADGDDDEEDIVIAKYAYASGQHRQDIDLKAGDEIEVHERGEKGWWQGKCLRTGQVGYFPGNYTVAPKLPYQLK